MNSLGIYERVRHVCCYNKLLNGPPDFLSFISRSPNDLSASQIPKSSNLQILLVMKLMCILSSQLTKEWLLFVNAFGK